MTPRGSGALVMLWALTSACSPALTKASGRSTAVPLSATVGDPQWCRRWTPRSEAMVPWRCNSAETCIASVERRARLALDLSQEEQSKVLRHLQDAGRSAMVHLLPLLDSNSLGVRRTALDLLGELGSVARAALPRVLAEARRPGTGNGMVALARIGGPAVLPLLEQALAQGDDWAAIGIVYVGPEAVPAIMHVLQARRTPGPTRELAWEALEGTTSPIRGHWECNYREGPCAPRARAEAARFAAVAPLTQLASSPEQPLELRRRALEMLRSYGEVAEPVLPLLRPLQEPGPLRPDALALEAVPDGAGELDALLGWIGGGAEGEALSRIARMGPAAAPAVPRLLALFEQADLGRRVALAEVLGVIADARAVPALLAALDAPSVRLAAAAAQALARIGDPAATTALTRMAHAHWAVPVRQVASEALRMRPPKDPGAFPVEGDAQLRASREHLRELVDGARQCERPCPPRDSGWDVSPWWRYDRIPELATARSVAAPKGAPYSTLRTGLVDMRAVEGGWLLGWAGEDMLGGIWFVTPEGESRELVRAAFRGFVQTPEGLIALTERLDTQYGTYGPVLRLTRSSDEWQAEPLAELARDPAAWRMESDGTLSIFDWHVPTSLTPAGVPREGICP